MAPAKSGIQAAKGLDIPHHDSIEIVGATANNLKDVDVDFARGNVTMVIGPSGSGKSSLLSDTLAAESRTRIKRFLGIAEHSQSLGDVEAYVGPLPACVILGQGEFRASVSTTVGTASGLLPALRRLFLRHARPWSEFAQAFVSTPSAESYGQWLARHYNGWLTVSAVPLRWERGDGTPVAARLAKLGFETAIVRSRTDTPRQVERGRTVRLAPFKRLNPDVDHVIEVQVNRTMTSDDSELPAVLRRAFDAAGSGSVVVELHDLADHEILSGPMGTLLDSDKHWLIPSDPIVFAPPTMKLMSFNSPGTVGSGACRECGGRGQIATVQEEDLVTRPRLSMNEGAICLWTEKNYKNVNIQHREIEELRGCHGFDPDLPWVRLPPAAKEMILNGETELDTSQQRHPRNRTRTPARPFRGFVPAILRRSSGDSVSAQHLASIVSTRQCPRCHGTRWSEQARALRIGDFDLERLLRSDFSSLVGVTGPSGELRILVRTEDAIRQTEALHRFSTSLVSAGVGHLSGDRGMVSVSAGESRRIRLAALVSAPRLGLGILLDEPARGLHEADIAGLAESLEELKRGNTVILTDHRLSLASAADTVIEMGPRGGSAGGRVVRSGPPGSVLELDSVGQAIQRSPMPVGAHHPFLKIEGGTLHTLSDVNARIPLGRLVAVTGVSGSGKSTFVRGLLVPALRDNRSGRDQFDDSFIQNRGSWRKVEGADQVGSLVAMEQRRPQPDRRSIVATFMKVAKPMREAFASLDGARRLNLRPQDFGLNSGLGRCPCCLGLGEQEQVGGWVPCTRCGGLRFGEDVLAVRMNGLNFPEALGLPLSDLVQSGLNVPGLEELASLAVDLDLGYISLGRRVDRLSGGEVQRLRIARHLLEQDEEGVFLVLDEPTAGLHPSDVGRLLSSLEKIVERGRNTVVIVEHNIDLIKACDWVVDFGPGAGPEGGMIVGQGPPNQIAKLDTPTGRALRNVIPRPQRAAASKPGRPPAKASAVTSSEAEYAENEGWFRFLLSHASAPPEASDSASPNESGLAVGLNQEDLIVHRPHEMGGLDLELARLIIHCAPRMDQATSALAHQWGSHPRARLAISPYLQEIEIWGRRIPTTARRLAQDRCAALGLEPLIPNRDSDPLAFRVGSSQLTAEAPTPQSYEDSIRRALTIGGGYVELVDEGGRVLGRAGSRRLDLGAGVVAPSALNSSLLVRRGSGACTACEGAGLVGTIDFSLVIGQHDAALVDEGLFTPEALAILRGVRRNDLVPFFRRLALEGLLDDSARFDKLSPEQRTQFLYGYWFRPGHGSFLKKPGLKPDEVRSWLRWDGLAHHVLNNLKRSPDSLWARRVGESVGRAECPVCEGTGLMRLSRVVGLHDRSLFDWTKHGTIGELATAIGEPITSDAEGRPEREVRMRRRLLWCLEPFLVDHADLPLFTACADRSTAAKVFRRVVAAYTWLDVVPASAKR